jgi:hypothetical protein
VPYVPNQLVVPAGETREFVVRVTDEDGDVQSVDVSEGAWVSDFKQYGDTFVAKIMVPSTLESIWVMATDWCGNRMTVERPVIVVHPPSLNSCSEGWERGEYKLQWEAFDEDLITCAYSVDFVEYLTFTYSLVSSGGGDFTGGYDGVTADCMMHPHGRVPGIESYCVNAYYTPPSRGKPRLVYLFITVQDAWGFEDCLDRKLVNDPPDVQISQMSPPAASPVEVRYGEMVTATVTATDREGDWVVLKKDSGPGSFPTVEGQGQVSGTYTWVASSRQPWHVVCFSATDSDVEPPEYSYAYLLIHIIQPPTAYDGHVTVPRGGTATASLYLSDPDTPSDGLKVTLTPPPGIKTRVVAIEEPPDYYGSYYGYTARVEVSVADVVAHGVYAVDFTVTDPDDLSDSAALLPARQPGWGAGQLGGLTLDEARIKWARVMWHTLVGSPGQARSNRPKGPGRRAG